MSNAWSADQSRAGIAIRVATPSDAEILARLRYAFRSSLSQADESEESFIERCTAWMKARLENVNYWKCWMAESADAPVGNLWAQIIEKIPNPTAEPAHHAYITNFYVREDWRGRGVGSSLLMAAMAWIQTKEAHAVILWPSERSRPLYLRTDLRFVTIYSRGSFGAETKSRLVHEKQVGWCLP